MPRQSRAKAASASAPAPTPAEPLADYAARRDFSRTTEPAPGSATPAQTAGAESRRFVVQKHAARRLHYDLRLELHGRLLSFAVTRGPSLVAGEKRLAVRTEDHPLEYLDFEGVIPAGGYGAGTMILWDQGTWALEYPEKDPEQGLAAGKLELLLQGKRLRGAWHMVRMAAKPGDKAENWLLIKSRDEGARPKDAADILEQCQTSILSGLTNQDLEATAPLPGFVEPALCSRAARPPQTPGWSFEIKYDGYRMQARIEEGAVTLRTRSGLDWTDRFPTIARALAALPGTALLDGELVAEDPDGAHSLASLTGDLTAGRQERLAYHAFDILHRDGQDLRPRPLLVRRRELARLLPEPQGPLRRVEHLTLPGAEVLAHACALGLEGIIAKRDAATYRSGRGLDWLKIPCAQRLSAVILGMVATTTQRRGRIGALAFGLPDGPEGQGWRYIGRVGTGYSDVEAARLWTLLTPLRRPTPPEGLTALPEAAERRGLLWVEPQLVGEVAFRGWTGDGRLRHASWQGLREDQSPPDLRLQQTDPAVEQDQAEDPEMPRTKTEPSPVLPTLTHPERLLWPEDGVSKAGLAEYLQSVADWLLPQIAGRALALVRCPDGIGEDCFYQKHAWAGLAEDGPIRLVDLGDGDQGLVLQDEAGLQALAQASVTEIHPWGSRADDPEHPDRVIFDLDPGEGTGWAEVVAGALAVRERLQAEGFTPFLKTSGGKGLHVVVALKPQAAWPAVKAWAESLARSMARDEPERYVATLSKAERKGRIFIDYLRNGRGSTAVAAYSPRARPGAPVACPITWAELPALTGANRWTIARLPDRLAHLPADPWAEMAASARPLEVPSGSKRRRRG